MGDIYKVGSQDWKVTSEIPNMIKIRDLSPKRQFLALLLCLFPSSLWSHGSEWLEKRKKGWRESENGSVSVESRLSPPLHHQCREVSAARLTTLIFLSSVQENSPLFYSSNLFIFPCQQTLPLTETEHCKSSKRPNSCSETQTHPWGEGLAVSVNVKVQGFCIQKKDMEFISHTSCLHCLCTNFDIHLEKTRAYVLAQEQSTNKALLALWKQQPLVCWLTPRKPFLGGISQHPKCWRLPGGWSVGNRPGYS